MSHKEIEEGMRRDAEIDRLRQGLSALYPDSFKTATEAMIDGSDRIAMIRHSEDCKRKLAAFSALVASLGEMYNAALGGDFYLDYDEATARIGRAMEALRLAEGCERDGR